MKIIGWLLLLSLSFSFAEAALVGDTRRVEEEKRESLRSSETQLFQESSGMSLDDQVDEEMLYFSELLTKKEAKRSDIFQALAVFLKIHQDYPDLKSQIAFFTANGFIPLNMIKDFDPNEVLHKGFAAYMFCVGLDIEGGVTSRLFGLTPRYAFKELVYEGIMLSGHPQDVLSGEELTRILINAANYTNYTK